MNKIIRNALIIVVVLAIVAYISSKLIKKDTQRLSPQDTVEYSDNGLKIKMVYCRPYKKGRLIFGPAEEGALQPFGQYWRLGANEATTLETNKDLTIGGHDLPAGKYSMYAVPGENIWKFGINKVADRWGAAEPDYTQDLFTFEVPVTYTDEEKEQFVIYIGEDEGQLTFLFWWDTSKLLVPFNVKEQE